MAFASLTAHLPQGPPGPGFLEYDPSRNRAYRQCHPEPSRPLLPTSLNGGVEQDGHRLWA